MQESDFIYIKKKKKCAILREYEYCILIRYFILYSNILHGQIVIGQGEIVLYEKGGDLH